MSAVSLVLQRLVERIESAEVLDGPAAALSSVVDRAAPDGPVKDALSGTWLGHAVHPAAVLVPAGAWLSATALDLTSPRSSRAAARRLVGLGVLAAGPAAATGASDWSDTEGAEKRVGLVHAGGNYLAIALQVASWRARGRGRHGRGVVLSAAATGLMGVTAWLGGHLAYAYGVGVDTTAFTPYPDEWTGVGRLDDLPEGQPVQARANGVPVLLVRDGATVRALGDRCSHRGGPLSEGQVEDGCVTCPWHGSRFRLADGAVDRGPATMPQPVLDVRVVDGAVQVRHRTQQALRTNPVS